MIVLVTGEAKAGELCESRFCPLTRTSGPHRHAQDVTFSRVLYPETAFWLNQCIRQFNIDPLDDNTGPRPFRGNMNKHRKRLTKTKTKDASDKVTVKVPKKPFDFSQPIFDPPFSPFWQPISFSKKGRKRTTKSEQLRAEAERLIKEGKMPSLERVLETVIEVRKKYRPLIERARIEEKKKGDRHD